MGLFEVWLAKCHLQNKEDRQDYACEAAVWASGQSDFEEKLIQHLKNSNFKKVWIEECFPIIEYLRRNARQEKVGAIAHSVNENRLVSLSILWPCAQNEADNPQQGSHYQTLLPKLKETPSRNPIRKSKYPVIPKKTLQDHARQWHLRNPNFAFDILKKVGLIKSNIDQDAAGEYLQEAARIGFSSKKDLILYTGACLHAKGSLCKVASFRSFVENCYANDTDIMQRFMDKMTVNYWTYLPEKIKKTSERRPE